MSLEFEYFYGSEAEQYSFYRIPKVLFKDKMFKDISAEAKILYGLMLDRMGLSVKNRWFDEKNRVYIIYTIAEIMEDLGCADQKVGRLLSELDSVKGIGLIERRRQGLGKPNIIYVKNFCYTSQIQNSENHDLEKVEITIQENPNSRFKNSENHDSGKVIITDQEYPNSRANDNNINNTDFNKPSLHIPFPVQWFHHLKYVYFPYVYLSLKINSHSYMYDSCWNHYTLSDNTHQD